MEIKIIGIITPILFGLCMFILRNLHMRLNKLENAQEKLDFRLRTAVTEPEVRQILADKLLPIDIKTAYISDDIIEMKDSLDKFIDRYIIKEVNK